jgi:hypothetical protein
MADNEEEQIAPTEEEQKSTEEAKQEAEKPTAVTMEMIEQMRAENNQLREVAMKAQRDSAASQEYLQRMVNELKLAAARGNTRGGEGSSEGVDMREALNENPEAVLDHHFATRMQPLIQQSLGYQIETAKTLFEQRHSQDEDYVAYKDELTEFMKGIPPEVKANPAAWDNAMDFVRAKHLKEIVERRTNKIHKMDKQAFGEPPSGSAPMSSKKPTLNDDQKAIAEGLGLTEAEYMEFLIP